MILNNNSLVYLLEHEKNLLQITTTNHTRTWEYYHEQYDKAFRVLLEIAKQKDNQTNSQFMPFLFIMRHSLELFLKKNISNTQTSWEEYGNTHNLESLYKIANIDASQFLESFECLNCNSEGECFRYLSDKEGNLYFDNIIIKAFEACNYYCSLLDDDNSLTQGGIDRGLQSELTYYTRECYTLGIIGTQYDFAIENILLAIQKKQISINDVYLPLLFLLRHCLEIKLKFSIMDLGNVVNDTDRAEASSTHSVKVLYNILANHINPAIQSIPEPEFKKDSESLLQVSEQYKDIIASLDANSFLFRFPMDKKGNESNFKPTRDCVFDILNLYKKSDPFLCFVVGVLYEAGVLRIGADKESEYYE